MLHNLTIVSVMFHNQGSHYSHNPIEGVDISVETTT